jgi:transposase
MNTLPEKKPVVHAGLDVAKAALQLHLQGRQHALPNTPAGHAQLVALPGAHVVCEATGGYERAVVAALPVSVVNPARVRHFARAHGRSAKNDPLDAAVLSAFGAAL